MAVIRPFRGLRPKPDRAKQVAAPPYDVLTSDEARELVRDNPDSFLRVNKSEVDFPADADVYSNEIYQRGRENLLRLINDGIMVRDGSPALYLYRLTWKGQSQTGLVCLSSVDEYDAGKIKKHEHTRPKKVNDRATHILTLKAQVGPVFSTFRTTDAITAEFTTLGRGEATVKFTADDEVTHELWVLDDQAAISELIELFGALDAIYIADGHHRSQSASEVRRRLMNDNPDHTGDEHYNYFLNVLFPHDQLRILPYNRVVKDTNGLSTDRLLEMIGENFEVAKANDAIAPKAQHEYGLYVGGNWYLMTAKPGTFDAGHPAHSIDAEVLTVNLLTPILGLEDIRTDDRIDFVGGIRGTAELEKLVDSKQYALAVSLAPVTVEQLLAVADAGEVMPPKSTWFEPKLRSGMVVNLLED